MKWLIKIVTAPEVSICPFQLKIQLERFYIIGKMTKENKKEDGLKILHLVLILEVSIGVQAWYTVFTVNDSLCNNI